MDQRLKHNAETIKLLQENRDDSGFGNGFWDLTPKAQATKDKHTKRQKLNFLKIKNWSIKVHSYPFIHIKKVKR